MYRHACTREHTYMHRHNTLTPTISHIIPIYVHKPPTYIQCMCHTYMCMHAYIHTSKVKYFDKKLVYEDYKKKLEREGFQPLPLEEDDTGRRKRWHHPPAYSASSSLQPVADWGVWIPAWTRVVVGWIDLAKTLEGPLRHVQKTRAIHMYVSPISFFVLSLIKFSLSKLSKCTLQCKKQCCVVLQACHQHETRHCNARISWNHFNL